MDILLVRLTVNKLYQQRQIRSHLLAEMQEGGMDSLVVFSGRHLEVSPSCEWSRGHIRTGLQALRSKQCLDPSSSLDSLIRTNI